MTDIPSRWVLYAYTAAGGSDALDEQLAAMRDWVACAHGTVVREYIDAGSSRQERANALARVAAGDADAVIAYDLLRLGRGHEDREVVRQAATAGTTIFALTENRYVTLDDLDLVSSLTPGPSTAAIGGRERARLRRETLAQRRAAQRFVDEHGERVHRLEKDLGVTVRGWTCPCLLRYPDRSPEHVQRRELECGVENAYIDHGSSWWRDGRLVAVVNEPYGINGEEVSELARDCARHDLKVEITAEHSTHFPPRTVAVIVMRSEDQLPDRDESA